MELSAEVKFEYSNSSFHTAQMFVSDFTLDNKNLTLKLSVNKTDCKASETCGVPAEEVNSTSAGCEPGSGCC